jgi:hypothetical protein
VLCGYSADLALTDTDEDLYSRKIKTKGLTITYEYVKADRFDIFEKAFDLLERK